MGILGNPNILKLMQKGDIEGFEKALKHKDPSVRKMALEALVVIAGGGGGYHNLMVREKACWAISKAFKESKDPRVCIEAAGYLRLLYKRGGLPQELRKAVRAIMPKLEKMFDEKGEA